MTIQNDYQGQQFKPNIYQGKKRGQERDNCYDRGRQQDWNGQLEGTSSEAHLTEVDLSIVKISE